MASYILRKIDDELWKRIKAQAAREGVTIRVLVEGLLTAWLGTRQAKDPEQGHAPNTENPARAQHMRR